MDRTGHAVAVIGGATAGAEVAAHLASRGAFVAVFEQRARPYGKIEDGLPRWHATLRQLEYDRIRAKLATPGVHLVPFTKVGQDVAFDELAGRWGFSAVVLANGAWRDRPLSVPDAERWVGRGLEYQNSFVIAFNHADDPTYSGPVLPLTDDAVVVGGGLASIDVAKILMLERTRRALGARGVECTIVELEHRGIPAFLERQGLTLDELGVRPATVYYRRELDDMPVVELPSDATAERAAKVRESRRRLVAKATGKYLFRVEPLCAPEELLHDGTRVTGLRFRRTRSEGGKLVLTEERLDVPTTLVVSAIGSVPEPIAGVPMRGELYDFTDWDLGRLEGYPNVFAAGNIVTGRGNIVASRRHAVAVSAHMASGYLGLGDEPDQSDDGAGERAMADAVALATARRAGIIAERMDALPRLGEAALADIAARVRARQLEVGYDGELGAWLDAHAPVS